MRKVLIWLLNAAIFIGVGGLGYRALGHAHLDRDDDEKKDSAEEKGKEKKVPSRVSRTPSGETIVTFDKEMQQRIGLKSVALTPAAWRPVTIAYGVLREDPSRTFVLRAPVAGILHGPASGGWPTLGTTLADGALIGSIEPKLTPVEQVDLASRLVQARAEVPAAEAALAAARASYQSKVELNKQNKIVSDRTLEEAEAKVRGEEARLEAARDIVRLIDATRATPPNPPFERGGDGGVPTKPLPLRVARGGEVVECTCRVGEMVDAGQVLLRTARFDHLLARVDVPVGEPIDESAAEARLATIERPDEPLAARRVMLTTGGEERTRGRVLVYRIEARGQPLRPGMAVIAYLPAGGAQRKGVVIPREAVVRITGQTWVYVQTGETTFLRREAQTTQPAENGWFFTSGFAPGERVVVDGAVALVSEELKPQGEAD